MPNVNEGFRWPLKEVFLCLGVLVQVRWPGAIQHSYVTVLDFQRLVALAMACVNQWFVFESWHALEVDIEVLLLLHTGCIGCCFLSHVHVCLLITLLLVHEL